MSANIYSRDVALIRAHAEVLELAAEDGARVAVVPAWQGRVMTSTAPGAGELSFGWINELFIAAGAEDAAFNNYGGEDRLWLGPEAGQFGLWFAPGEPFDLDHWRTPEGLNRGPFEVVSASSAAVEMTRRFRVGNYAGTCFDCALRRTIRRLDRPEAAERLRAELPDAVALVAFESENVLANAGEEPWTRNGGLLSVWILAQLKPLPRGRVIVPIRPGNETDLGPPVTTDYFGPIPPDRCRVTGRHVLFACDGRFRSKIGVSPRRSRGVLGSYDPDAGVLTVVKFNQPLTAPELPYVNSLWEIQDDPFAGDAANAYNDGEPAPGAGQLGPFYELESSSPAAALRPGESITHIHTTFHLVGPPEALGSVGRRVLGIDPEEAVR